MATPAFKTVPGPAWQQWNSLQRLWASLYVIWALDAVLLLLVIVGVRVHREGMKGVGKDTAPSIISALHIKSALSDMDANFANELLGVSGAMKAEVDAYEEARKDASKSLIEAAKNITFDEAEQQPIEAIQVAMGTFEAKVQHARDLHDRGDEGYVEAYRAASKVMDEAILPQADQLDKVNHDELENTYSSVSTRSVGALFMLLLAGGALLVALIWVQSYLSRQTHRTLNPVLILTTLIALIYVLYTFGTLGEERHQLKVAKEDAFQSIHALWRARAVAFAANADESRYLLDTTHAADHETAFFTKTDLLAKLPTGMTLADAQNAAQQDRITGFKGYLADELNNITFPGEKEAAVTTLANFEVYMKIDSDIRGLQRSGKHAEALKLCTGTKMGESDWAFEQFDKALGKTLEINKTEFDQSVEKGLSDLSYFEAKATIISLLIGGLAFFGMLPRLREYR
jgi:hypothetical protein